MRAPQYDHCNLYATKGILLLQMCSTSVIHREDHRSVDMAVLDVFMRERIQPLTALLFVLSQMIR